MMYGEIIERCFPSLPSGKIVAIERLLSECEPFIRGESDDIGELLELWEHNQPEYVDVVYEVEESFRAMSVMVNENAVS